MNRISNIRRRSLYLRGTAILLIVLGMMSCGSVGYINFQVMRPADVTISADVNTLAFVERNQQFKGDTLRHYFKINDKYHRDSIQLDTAMGRACYYGLVENLPDYLHQDTIPFFRMPATTLSDTVTSFPRLKWSEVDSLCSVYGSDILVVLEASRMVNKYTLVGNYDDGYYGANDIVYWGYWRIYDPLLKHYVDEHLVRDSLFMEENSSTFKNLYGGIIPDRLQSFADVGYTLGEGYARRITPRWDNVSRAYFCFGEKRLEASCYYIRLEQWDKASALLEQIVEEKDSKWAGRACYNLALIYEMKGDISTAISWIRKSMYFFKKEKKHMKELKLAQRYSLMLTKRRQEQKKLKEYFGE